MSKLNLPNFNSTDYPLAVKSQISSLTYDEQMQAQLKYHQFVAKEFFTRTDSRGMLVCHSMGQGKTRLAAAIAMHFREFEPNRRVILLSAKSLADNFKKEVKEYAGLDAEQIEKNFRFVSLNSSNMYSALTKLDKDKEQIALEEKFGAVLDDAKILEGSLMIIDEAHNLFNSITNGAKNAIALYDTIMKTDMKLIFLSGTPMINDPFELVPAFNMLRGLLKNNKERVTLFSEDNEEFEHWFIDVDEHKIKNKDRFINRIFGLVSYYGDLYFEDSKDKPGFPKELETIVEHVHMSQTQFARYISARISELEESKHVYKSKAARFSSAKGATSTYRVKSRQISNYCIPEYALGPARGNKAREKFLDKITDDDLINLNEFSPKIGKIISNINKHKGTRGMVYSQFVSGEGIGIFERVIEALGWERFGTNDYDIKQNKRPHVFAVLSGEIQPDERSRIIQEFNQPEQKIDLLLLSGAVAEGIDLKRIRHVHIMEPFWNYARINQVKTRAIRYGSHVDLPPAEQNVQVYVYLSDYPMGYPKKKITEPTTDVDLYQTSIANMRLIDTFMLALVEASVDCAIHHAKLPPSVQQKIQCKLCAPTGMKLFHELLNIDMELPNPCNPFIENKKSVQTLNIDGVDYKYSDDGKVYHWNTRLKGWAPIPRNDPSYGKIHAAVKDLI